MTDQSKQWIITEQGIKEAARGCVTHMIQCRKPITDEKEHLAEIIAAHSQASPPASELQLWAAKSRASRTAWLESHGVPVSLEFGFFAEAIGTLIELCESAPGPSCAAPPQGTPTPELGTCDYAPTPHAKIPAQNPCKNWKPLGHSTVATQTDPFSKGYKHRRGEPVSDACGDGKHAECTQTLDKCHCTVRMGHTTLHAYVNPPVAAQKEKP